jgi:hypothetical protein
MVLGLGLALLNCGPVGRAAQNKPKGGASKRKAVARCVTVKATIIRRTGPRKPWKVVAKNGRLYAGDLLIGLPGAALVSRNGAVRLDLLADLDRLSPHPIREAAVVLHENRDTDLDVTLDRGRIDLVNRKKKGAAKVRLRVRYETWDLTLEEPGATVALELYSSWPAGSRFTEEPGPKDAPTADLVILVLKGQALVRHGDVGHGMTAPPGPAMIEWDSVHGQDQTPKRLEKLPLWAQTGGQESLLARKKKDLLRRWRKTVVAKGIDAAVAQFLDSDKMTDRALAVFVMGATDDLRGLAKAVREAKHPDVLETAVVTLRHWIGRAPGQEQILYNGLIKVGQYDPVDAKTVVQLLHSFGEDELARPELYQALIDFLDHEKFGLRALAYWHLRRLVPQGEAFGYNPSDPKEKRDAAVAKWRKLIPEGKMPPKAEPARDKP